MHLQKKKSETYEQTSYLPLDIPNNGMQGIIIPTKQNSAKATTNIGNSQLGLNKKNTV
jgi:hypothetical protein